VRGEKMGNMLEKLARKALELNVIKTAKINKNDVFKQCIIHDQTPYSQHQKTHF
jgi:hypothetical protein